MLKRGIVGLIALVFAILACGVVVSMAQRSATVYASPPRINRAREAAA